VRGKREGRERFPPEVYDADLSAITLKVEMKLMLSKVGKDELMRVGRSKQVKEADMDN